MQGGAYAVICYRIYTYYYDTTHHLYITEDYAQKTILA